MRHACWLLLVAMAILSSGCVSMNAVTSEEQYSGPWDTGRACIYSWEIDETLFRASNIAKTIWGPIGRTRFQQASGALTDVLATCKEARAKSAKVSGYYLEYDPSTTTTLVTIIPLAFLTGATFGTAPLPILRRYAVCVQARAADGLDRLALAEGSIFSATNLYAMDQAEAKTIDLMRQLTVQAWHKLWLPDTKDDPRGDCEERLAAITGEGQEPARADGTALLAPATLSRRDRRKNLDECFDIATAQAGTVLADEDRARLQGRSTEKFFLAGRPVASDDNSPSMYLTAITPMRGYGAREVTDRYVLCFLSKGYVWPNPKEKAE